jgi:XTP/dITP diphosphohydrolase
MTIDGDDRRMRLVLATHNEHKRRELARLLPEHEVAMLPDDVQLPPEDGETFAENALGKARAAARTTGEVAIADDSGIEAAALGGAPGVRSARYAGERATDLENLQKLLREAPAGSALAYVCALAYVDPGEGIAPRRGVDPGEDVDFRQSADSGRGVERVFEARCTGRLAAKPRGERGFGYDPAFLPDDSPPVDDRSPVDAGSPPDTGLPADVSSPVDGSTPAPTMAQLSDAQKDAISHRGRAARALAQWLKDRESAL